MSMTVGGEGVVVVVTVDWRGIAVAVFCGCSSCVGCGVVVLFRKKIRTQFNDHVIAGEQMM